MPAAEHAADHVVVRGPGGNDGGRMERAGQAAVFWPAGGPAGGARPADGLREVRAAATGLAAPGDG